MTNWKAIAIVFIILFVASWLFIAWGVYLLDQEEKKMNTCYYDICSGYPQAWIDNNVCFCYDYDVLGNLQEVKTEYMK